MDITGLLATIASNFRAKYLNLAQQFERLRPPIQNQSPKPTAPAEPTIKPGVPVDCYRPSGEPVAEPAGSGAPAPDSGQPTTAATENPVQQKPDGTYYYQRQARLDYQLDLRFDLGAITQTVERLADGEAEAVDRFAAAGFGLQAAFDIKGFQRVQTNMAETEGSGRRHQLEAASARKAGKFLYQSRDFALKSFYREAARIRRSMHESAHGSHRRAVNRFAARFRIDSRFSFSQLERFSAQTEQITNDRPGATAEYVSSAGEVAAKGTTEMMATFFDAVDGYLDQSEQAILDRVAAFFDQAAEELGFSGTLVEQARTHLTGTIESFFDRVDSALAEIETRFIPQAQVPAPDIATEATDTAETPTPEPVQAATHQDKYTMATA